jgi:hypothetical protein
MPRETKFVVSILGGWLCLALAFGSSVSFRNASAAGVALTVWGLTALALLICWVFASARNWAAIVDLRALVAFHLTRFVGIYFLVLGARGQLPEGFAKPAGIGDIIIAIGAAAMLLLPQLRRRKILFIWNTFGLIDILFVAFSAFRFGVRDWASMAPLRELPLSLLPTFFVPLIIASHILIFIRLARKTEATETRAQPIAASVLKK